MKNRLKELRKLKQRSQAELARELGVSRQAVNGFESGKFDPSLEMAFKLASLFNVAIEDIFIYEAKNSMQTVVEQVKNFLGFQFGFERFTDNAIKVFNFARNEASRLHHLQVEPEHILAGLCVTPNSTSARLLQVNDAMLGYEIDELSFEPREKLKFSASSRFVLEIALQIVRLQRKQSIGTEHLLWGLVRLYEVNQATLDQQFQQYGIDCEGLNHQLAAVI